MLTDEHPFSSVLHAVAFRHSAFSPGQRAAAVLDGSTGALERPHVADRVVVDGLASGRFVPRSLCGDARADRRDVSDATAARRSSGRFPQGLADAFGAAAAAVGRDAAVTYAAVR